MNVSKCVECFNCGLCYNICPHHAITVDKSGTFYKPVVDEEKCTDCGLCFYKCPVNNEFDAVKPLASFAGWHRDHEVVRSSSSGGIFYGIARRVLNDGGVVFGAVYSEDNTEVVFTSSDDTELRRMQKSKYVESLINDAFSRIHKHLRENRSVLFCGTPCQVAGLKSFLGRNYEKLLFCDFACGGLPSHKMFQEYLTSLKCKYGSQVVSVDFRPKTHGWRRYAVLVKFMNGKVYNRLGVEDPFLRSFLYSKCIVRESCLDCKFSVSHQSDLTIADFWLNKELSTLANDNGISLVLCNTDKGRKAMEMIQSDYELQELCADAVSYNNHPTAATMEELEKRNLFLHDYRDKGFVYACQRNFSLSRKEQVKNCLRRICFRERGWK